MIHRNAYYAHPENLLLRMWVDGKKHIQMLAAKRVEVVELLHQLNLSGYSKCLKLIFFVKITLILLIGRFR